MILQICKYYGEIYTAGPIEKEIEKEITTNEIRCLHYPIVRLCQCNFQKA